MVNVSVPGEERTESRVMHTLMDLEGDATYEVQVAAFTVAGAGPLTDAVTAVIFQGLFS